MAWDGRIDRQSSCVTAKGSDRLVVHVARQSASSSVPYLLSSLLFSLPPSLSLSLPPSHPPFSLFTTGDRVISETSTATHAGSREKDDSR